MEVDCRNSFSVIIFLLVTLSLTQSQHFDSTVDDKTYLDRIERNVANETKTAQQQLIEKVKIIEDVTKVYIGATLKQNLFKALRVLAEKELMSYHYSIDTIGGMSQTISSNRKSKQAEEEEEGEEESSGSDTTSSSGGSTTRRPNTIIPQVANLLKAIFGGNSINITSYAQAATKYLPQSVGNQVLGVVKLLAHNPSSRWSTTTPIPSTVVVQPNTDPTIFSISKRTNGSFNEIFKSNHTRNSSVTTSSVPVGPILIRIKDINQNSTTPGKGVNTASKPKGPSDEDEEEEEEDNSRQLKLPNFGGSFNVLSSLLSPATRRPTMNATTESASGFEEEATKTNELDLRELASGIRSGLGDLIKVVPDLFKGAREAVGLLSGIQSLLGSFGG